MIGSVLIIVYANEKTFVAKFLSIKPIVAIGLISYSAYLWQQPIFSFAKIRFLEEPSKLFMFMLSILSLLIATITWKYIEKPLEKNKIVQLIKKCFFIFNNRNNFFLPL